MAGYVENYVNNNSPINGEDRKAQIIESVTWFMNDMVQ